MAADRDPELEALLARVRELENRAGHVEEMGGEIARLREQLTELTAARRASQIRLLPPIGDSAESDSDREIPVTATVDGELPQAPDLAEPIASSTPHSEYGKGLDISFWGWLSYIASPQERYSTFWAWEAEIDITKSFTEYLAASADIDFVDTNDGAWANIEQLFVSILLPCDHDAIFTAGKFNAPFGVEPRDFWDRQTASTSLLFPAQPHDLTGLMLTQPCDTANLTFRTFVVNGFDNNLDVNRQPSIGLMVEHRPCSDFSVALTNWWGPEFADNNDDKLYFTEAQATWHVTPKLCFAGEFLYGTTDSPDGRLDYTGYLTILSYALCDDWKLFGQWSDLNDRGGFITGEREHQQQASAGLAWYLHPHVEARFEYRHNISRERIGPGSHTEDEDEISAHLTFGY